MPTARKSNPTKKANVLTFDLVGRRFNPHAAERRDHHYIGKAVTAGLNALRAGGTQR